MGQGWLTWTLLVIAALEGAAIAWLVVRTNYHARNITALTDILKSFTDEKLGQRPGESVH